MTSTTLARSLGACLLTALFACSSPSPGGGQGSAPVATVDLGGTWRFIIDSGGGELPFTVEILAADERARSKHPAYFVNGSSRDPITEVSVQGRRVTLRISHYDSALTGDLDDTGTHIRGTWQKTSARGRTSLPFHAIKSETHRFSPEPPRPPGAADAVPSVAGTWIVTFKGEGEEIPAIGELQQDGETASGTFLTSGSDTRFLAGRYTQGVLELSSFNGAFASLFRARARADGTLSGEFWSNDDQFFTWNARRSTAEDAAKHLPDPSGVVKVLDPDRRLHFRFPDLDGNVVSIEDERFAGRVVVVVLFGSWCQNCNDEAPLLTQWHRRYRDRGLDIVGLAFEFTGDRERDRRQVLTYKQRHEIEYPLLLAGTTNESSPLPELSAIPTFPTTLFIGRDGRVRTIHSGFAGPSTGVHHERLVAQLEAEIEALLAEKAP